MQERAEWLSTAPAVVHASLKSWWDGILRHPLAHQDLFHKHAHSLRLAVGPQGVLLKSQLTSDSWRATPSPPTCIQAVGHHLHQRCWQG